MTGKTLGRLLAVLFGLYVFFAIGSFVLELLFLWMPGRSGEMIANVLMWILCVYCFVCEVQKAMRENQNILPQIPGSPVHKNMIPKAAPTIDLPKKAKKQIKSESKEPPIPKMHPQTSYYFKDELAILDGQVERMDKREAQITDRINRLFSSSTITADKFNGTVEHTVQLFKKNCLMIQEHIELFDDRGFSEVIKRNQEWMPQGSSYQQQFEFIHKKLKDNETLLDRMTTLLLGLSDVLDSETSRDEQSVLNELNELVEQTKLYKTKNYD